MCAPRNFPRLPEDVQAWFACVQCAKEDNMPFDELLKELNARPVGQAFADWHQSIGATRFGPRHAKRKVG
jgi:hypothetical protein